MLRALRRVTLVAAASLLALLTVFAIVVSLGIEVDLSAAARPAQAAASTALGREVRIEGPLLLVPTWSPTLEVHDLVLSNPAGFEGAFARLSLARLRVGLLPLLRRRLTLREITAEGVEVILERNAAGAVNWEFDVARSEPPSEPDTSASSTQRFDPASLLIRSVEIEELGLRSIAVEIRDATGGPPRRFTLAELAARAGTDTPLALSMRGSLPRYDFEARLEGAAPSLLSRDERWPLRVELEVARTRFSLEARVEGAAWSLEEAIGLFVEGATDPLAGLAERQLGELEVRVQGERLDDLGGLLGVSLPPWRRHATRALLRSVGERRFEAELDVAVGSSSLEGRMTLASGGARPDVGVSLAAQAVQLDDFPLADSRAERAAATPGSEPDDRSDVAGLFDPASLQRLDARLDLRVETVRSGTESLGRAHLVAALREGRLRLEPLHLEVPGGSVDSSLRLAPADGGVDAQLSLQIDRFDYGILARRADPGTDMAGSFSADVALDSRAPSFARILEHAGGHFDFAIFPERFEAGVIDLWAVNLLSALGPAVDPDKSSKLNCVVALFDLQDGVMTQRSLLLDTSRMSVSGSARVDFGRREIEADLTPTPKRPEFLSAATPVQVRGDFEDFGVGVRAEDLIGTVIRLVTSVVVVPLRRLFAPGKAPEGLEACLGALEARRPGESRP